MPKWTTVYDQNMKRVALLENAFAVGYELPLNGLWTASFSLPADDPKNAECLPLRYVEIFDNGRRIDLFRIVPNTATRSGDGATISYQCEHVMGTLLDEVLFQFHTVGNLGYPTPNVIDYILGKQVQKRWARGNIAISRQFEYTWENENLLGALFSVPRPFDEPYMWSWDTTVYPWRLNLVAPPAGNASAYIRYGRNMTGIERTIDPTTLCTRLYPLGYGEGVNQLGIAELNGGVPYLDAPTQGQYGVISKIWVDQRFTSSDTLLARAQAILKELQIPYTSYCVGAADVSPITGDPQDAFWPGDRVRTIDEDLGDDFTATIVKVSKRDIFGAPGDVELEIANKTRDIAGSIADLSNRTRIQEVYAQGATNIDTRDFADNADPSHPAKLRFYVPEEAVRINKVLLNWTCEPFRAYSRAIEGGGAIATSTAAGGGTTTSTASGGGTTTTSGASSITTTGPSSTTTTAAGGGIASTKTGIYIPEPGIAPEPTASEGEHNHGIPNGTVLRKADGTTVTFALSGLHQHNIYNHGHDITLPDHAHEMKHTHDMPHTHGITIPNHTHDVTIPDHTHNINLPNHTHGIEYGIYEGPTPNVVQITVDGQLLPDNFPATGEVDLLAYLAKDGSGRINRGTFHEIKIAPISLGRIAASVVTQIFVQSRGGGNY